MTSPLPTQARVPARPFLKWAGGKGRLITQYGPHFPQNFGAYYEPFLGGGAIFFHLQPEQAVLSDVNPELVNVYTCVRDRIDDVLKYLETHACQHGHDYYYQIRALNPSLPAERAARFIYLNRTCFNGLYRENSKGQFNVPMGRYKKPKICDVVLLKAVSEVLQAVQIHQQPFETILEVAQSAQDFVYFDPPYHPISATSDFTAYSKGAFTAKDQTKLAQVFAELASRGVQVMLSNSDCSFIRDLYQSFNIYSIQAARAINSNPQKRGKITEVLVTSW
ncbi:DNA adenine methylase [Acaryochloris marina]|uniref:Site-specific DNA-methyltransferase (adenine-specific) n=1 Tax=Acaryochloris marina (strain MBIC 11017) TaxID=329726 RepID=B0CDK6_ACAM1|nr:DNA adenine methylase [Acaryochloris marina]ABW28075.1 DNA adenine methylase [Acaryochloris marina MBIC11017]BDM82784.1 site-specific DNA-methyltransferase (adenine-specific) [Acaryochloris marina MBIC10699]